MEGLLRDRVKLANLPTPVQPMERMSRRLGVELFVKRDDLTESVASGNKIRKLEYVLHRALSMGADTLVTCGGVQSNHCRATAWTAARTGLECVLLLRGERPDIPDGNLLLDSLLGADIRFHSPEEFQDIGSLAAEVCRKLESAGKRPYFIPMGASTATGSLGYVGMSSELAGCGTEFDHIYCAAGSGGTLAGIALGCRYFGLRPQVHGIAVCDDRDYFLEELARIGEEFLDRYGIRADLPGPGCEIDDGFVGAGYAVNTDEELIQLVRLARVEGMVLDPVYTLKAFLGLAAHVERGAVGPGERVLFLHSGGHFGLMSAGFGVQEFTGW